MSDHKDLLDTMRQRMDQAQSAEVDHRLRAEDDLRFVIGDQWTAEARAEREADGRPCLTINLMAQNVRQVTGQIRAINPAVRVSPADNEATKDVADIIEGMVRHIEYRSDASSVYEAGAESAAACSIGYWRVRAQYCDGDTFDQEALIERIHNPFAVFFDPFAKDPTRKDAKWAFIVEEMHKDEFVKQYPKADMTDFTSEHRAKNLVHWSKKDAVVIAEYFWIDEKEHEIGLLPSGQTMRGPFAKGMKPSKTRKVVENVVMWAKVSGAEVLEGPSEFPCRYIPVIAVTGEEWHLGEGTYRSGVIRHAKDSQSIFNYAETTQVEIGAMQSKAPFMVTAKQVAGHTEIWNTMGQKNRPYLVYNGDPAAPGAPQRVQPPVSSEALLTQSQMAAENIKRTTGIYDASLGARSNETSGVAINARKEESQSSTSIYADNMVKGIAHTGCILVDMIPRIYDTKRTVRVLGEDGQEKMKVINDLMMDQNGARPVNDMTVGKYDVRVQVGASYSTRREQAQDGMFQFLKVFPDAAPITGDLMAKMQDWPEADRVAERLRKMLPPGIAEDDEEDMTPEQQQAKAQAMQAQQQEQQAMQAAQQVAMQEAQANADKAEADARKAAAEAQLKEFELAQITGQLDAMIQQRVTQTVSAMMQPPQMPEIEIINT